MAMTISNALDQYLKIVTGGNVLYEYAPLTHSWRFFCKDCKATMTLASEMYDLARNYEKKGILDESIQKFATAHRQSQLAKLKENTKFTGPPSYLKDLTDDEVKEKKLAELLALYGKFLPESVKDAIKSPEPKKPVESPTPPKPKEGRRFR